MTLGITAAGVATAATYASAAYSAYSAVKGAVGGKGGNGGGGGRGGYGIEVPAFQADQYYKPSQDYLFDYGRNTLDGNINDYYKPIGESGGPEFQKFMANVVRDTSVSTDEDLVRRGVSRGGLGAALTAKNVSDVSAKYGYADYGRALAGRQGLLTLGTGITEGVRSAGLTNQEQMNSYALKKAELEQGIAVQDYNLSSGSNEIQSKANGSWLDSIFQQGAGAINDYSKASNGGMSPDQVEAAVAGSGKIGSAAGSQNWLDALLKTSATAATIYAGTK